MVDSLNNKTVITIEGILFYRFWDYCLFGIPDAIEYEVKVNAERSNNACNSVYHFFYWATLGSVDLINRDSKKIIRYFG